MNEREKFLEYAKMMDIQLTCPACGNDDWDVLPGRISIDSHGTDFNPSLLMVACVRCFHVRLFLLPGISG